MLCLKPFTVPKRFIFIDPDTGFRYQEKTRAKLVERIVAYRAQNKLEQIPELNIVLENYWCSLEENAGSCIRNKEFKLKRGFFETIKGGIVVLKNLYYGDDNIVSQSQADARSEICAKCPFNVFPDKTDFIKWSDEIAVASVGNRRASKHDAIGNCSVCSCPLRAKVWYKGANKLSETQKMQMSAVNCWQVKENG